MRVVRLTPRFVRISVFAGCFVASSLSATAQEKPGQPTQVGASDVAPTSLVAIRLAIEPQVPRSPSVFAVAPIEEPARPAALMPLYGSLVALQGLDIHSTRRAVGSGAGQEANPAMEPIVRNSAAFIAVKAGATVGVIWASEKMWKKNRKAAVIFASVVNVAMAAIVANNYRVNR